VKSYKKNDPEVRLEENLKNYCHIQIVVSDYTAKSKLKIRKIETHGNLKTLNYELSIQFYV
jgi:hypothetical protein